jgi:hypothetical protein
MLMLLTHVPLGSDGTTRSPGETRRHLPGGDWHSYSLVAFGTSLRATPEPAVVGMRRRNSTARRPTTPDKDAGYPLWMLY